MPAAANYNPFECEVFKVGAKRVTSPFARFSQTIIAFRTMRICLTLKFKNGDQRVRYFSQGCAFGHGALVEAFLGAVKLPDAAGAECVPGAERGGKLARSYWGSQL